VSWGLLEEQFGEVYTGRSATVADSLDAESGHLKHTYDLSDEVLCERRVETPVTNTSASKSSSSNGWCSIVRR
jgi:IS5 family transposase